MKTKLILTACCIILTSISFAGDCSETNGLLICNSAHAVNLNANGAAQITHSTVSGSTVINGSLNSTGSKYSSLLIRGNATLTDSSVTKNADILGMLKTRNSRFSGVVRLRGEKFSFETTIFDKDIAIKSKKQSTPVICLKASHVSGRIVFEGAKGIAYCDSQSTIKTGIVNGEIKKIRG